MSHSQFELEKDFYLGNYQSCVNKANSMPTSKESQFYMCLSYFHMKKYDHLALEVSKTEDQCVQLVETFRQYTVGPQNVKESTIEWLNSTLENKQVGPKDDLSRLIISSIYVGEKMYSSALKVLNQLDSLPALLAQVGVYLLMNRVDVAERHLKMMQNKDDYSTLTLLAAAQVKLASGNAKEAYDVSKELEDLYKATPLINNIQTAAAILMGNLDLAKQHCESALDQDNDNPEALINMIYIMSKLKSTPEIKNRYFSRLRTLDPEHNFVKEVERMETEISAS